MKADILTTNHGTIVSLDGNTKRGRAWLSEMCDFRAGVGIVEHRFFYDIACGAMTDGLRLKDTTSGTCARLPEDAG